MLSTKFQIIWEGGFRGDFLEINQLEKKNGLWWPCLLTDRDKMCNVYRVPSIDAYYQVSVHLARRLKIKM